MTVDWIQPAGRGCPCQMYSFIGSYKWTDSFFIISYNHGVLQNQAQTMKPKLIILAKFTWFKIAIKYKAFSHCYFIFLFNVVQNNVLLIFKCRGLLFMAIFFGFSKVCFVYKFCFNFHYISYIAKVLTYWI